MTLKTYTVDINGIEHTMQLDEADAERYGDRAKEAPTQGAKARTVQNKAATADTKEA